MKCPICNRKDDEHLLIDQSLLNDNEYYYFYCVSGCDAFTMEINAYEVMQKADYSEGERKQLLKGSLTKVISKSDLILLNKSS
jgi:hypothetical protein